MKTIIIISLIVLVAIIILFLYAPTIRVMMVVSGDTKSAYYAFRHKLFAIERGKILILDDGSVSVVNKKSILLQKPIPKGIMMKFGKKIWNVLNIKKLKVYVSMQGNNMQEALALGALGGMSGILDSLMPLFTNADVHFEATRSRERGAVAVETNIKISLIRTVICFISAKKEYEKELKEKNYAKTN